MKKIHVAMVCLLAGVSIMMTGCKKEEGELVTLGAEMADGTGDAKVYLDGDGYPSWESTDHLWVNGDEKTLSNITGTKAKIDNVTSASEYYAVYPYDAGVSRDNSRVTVNIPRAQTFERTGTNQKIVAPMVAYAPRRMVSNTERTTLRFRNVCSLLKVHVTNNSGLPLIVNRIAVNSSTRITGSATTTVGENTASTPTVSTNSTNGHFDAVLQFNTVNESIPSGGEPKDYYVIVAPLSNANVIVSLYMLYEDNSGVKHDMHRSIKYTNVSLAQSQVAPVNIEIPTISQSNPDDSDNPYIDGHYTINSNGTQVRFSRGNLQYRKGMQTGELYEDWRVAINQYDIVGGNGSNGSNSANNPYGNVTTASGNTQCHNYIDDGETHPGIVYTQGKWIDLFGWGTGNDPLKHQTTDSQYPSFTDWGTNQIDYYNHRTGRLTPTGITWRTLTQAEWDYLFNTRVASTVNNVENARFAKVQVTSIPSVYTGSATSVYGILLFPDVFTWPSSINTLPGSINNASTLSFDSYTATQLKELQNEGAVFLPFGGYRQGTTASYPTSSLTNTSNQPFNYWSSDQSSYSNTSNPNYIYAKAVRSYYASDNNSFPINTSANYRRCIGASVRLVQVIQ